MAKRAVAKRSKRRGGGQEFWGWSSKALGLVLCAFFVLGMVTGLSQAGRALAARASHDARLLLGRSGRERLPSGAIARPRARCSRRSRARRTGDAVALVERHDGFYALFAEGELRGPVEASRAGDLPILSGAAVQTADAPDLVRYAAALVRAEVALSGLVSEMRLDGDGTVSLFFDRSHTELRVDLDDAPAQLKRATEVLGQWRGHEQHDRDDRHDHAGAGGDAPARGRRRLPPRKDRARCAASPNGLAPRGGIRAGGGGRR